MNTTTNEVLDAVRRRVDELRRPVLLGIVGPPGAGKTYAAAWTLEALSSFGIGAEVIPMDGFHLSNRQLERLNLLQRKGAPQTFDVDGFVALLERIRMNAGGRIFAPDYDRGLHEPIAARRCVEPETGVVVVEGNYLLHDDVGWAAIEDLLDVTWFIEVEEAVREARLVERQITGGKTRAEAETWVARVDGPNARVIQRGKARATFVTNGIAVDSELAERT